MILEPVPVEAPGGFAPVVALGTTDGSGMLNLVGNEAPLATIALVPDTPPPLIGSGSEAELAGPFVPTPLIPVFITLAGDWEGSVEILRSTDGGNTRYPLTLGGARWGAFSGNACEPVWVESERDASLYLNIKLESGAVEYRLAQ